MLIIRYIVQYYNNIEYNYTILSYDPLSIVVLIYNLRFKHRRGVIILIIYFYRDPRIK